MTDHRKIHGSVLLDDEASDGLQLLGGVRRPAERRVGLRRLAHLRISIGVSVAVKIKAPYVEAGFAQRIAPGISVEPMGDRKSRWERCAMDIQHGPHPHRPA